MSTKSLRDKQEELLQELHKKVPNQEVQFRIEDGTITYTLVGGFYKSGTVILKQPPVSKVDSGVLFIAESRYGKWDNIYSFSDLVLLNWHWFNGSCEKTWPKPSPGWEELLLEAGYITKEIITVYKRR